MGSKHGPGCGLSCETCRAAWPEPFLERWAAALEAAGLLCRGSRRGDSAGRHPLGMGADRGICRRGGQSGFGRLRLGIIGQTDGQRILAALEPVIAAAVAERGKPAPSGFGSATFAVELASIAHETQYTRLFRS